MSAPRDPRIDPKPGDVLAVRRKCIDCTRTFRRTVLRRPLTRWVVYQTGNGGKGLCLLGPWQRWAKYAEVLNTAEVS